MSEILKQFKCKNNMFLTMQHFGEIPTKATLIVHDSGGIITVVSGIPLSHVYKVANDLCTVYVWDINIESRIGIGTTHSADNPVLRVAHTNVSLSKETCAAFEDYLYDLMIR